VNDGARRRKCPVWPLLLALAAGCDAGTVAVEPDPPRPETVTVGPLTATLSAIGDTIKLIAHVTDQYGQAMAGVPVAWSVDSPGVVAVDSTGLAIARSNGSAVVTATADSVSGSATVTVAQTVAVVEIAPGAATLTAIGDTLRLTAAASDANGHAVAGVPVAWSVETPGVLAVDSTGLATARSSGMGVVTATAGGVSGSATVTVAQTVAVVEIALGAATLTAIGDTIRLAAAAIDANGHAVAGVPAAWFSDAPEVALVDSTGLLTARSNGTVAVTATAGGVSGSTTVTVEQAVAAVVLDRDSMTLGALNFGDGGELWARLTDANGPVGGPRGGRHVHFEGTPR